MVTVSRADYGLLRWVIREILDSKTLKLQLIATGAHFSEEQGYTVTEIVNDGFAIDVELPMAPVRTTPEDIIASLGKEMANLGSALAGLNPDIVVLLGDRSETIMVALVATILGLPLAHIHGGELTQGAIDDAFRHSITKMSHLHFVANDTYRNRVIQMGEDSRHVFTVGGLGHESVFQIERLTRSALSDKLGVTWASRNILVTLHPETLRPEVNDQLISEVSQSLKRLDGVNIFITAANVDNGGQDFNVVFQRLARDLDNVWFFHSLGTQKYLSLMAQVDAVVGNSSSGILEAPALQVPTINIGARQEGRVMSATVVNVQPFSADILGAIRAVFARSRQRAEFPSCRLNSRPSQQIVEKIDLLASKNLLEKKFVDAAPLA